MTGSSSFAYAHSLPGAPEAEWESLEVHLAEVAGLACEFAAAFDSAEWGRLAGLWHDLGKYRPEFQRRIRGSREQVEHAGVGAALANERKLTSLAFAIAGHHAGLANPTVQAGGVRALRERILENRKALDEVRDLIPHDLLASGSSPPLPPKLMAEGRSARQNREASNRAAEFWTRMLFSALVDADFLATERFCSPDRHAARPKHSPLDLLAERLDRKLAAMPGDSEVNRIRQMVLADCLRATVQPQGFFSLTVPTGGGKTLSSMAFALRHAARHGLRRVVVAVPFTTIIEQNAAVYRSIFGPDEVVEHHSNLDEEDLEERYGEGEIRRRLASQNWDAPIIVTTNVQLFESLFANRPSRCRKLHNLTRSVIILDEAQALPAGFLLPVIDALRELATNYGCTVLLSTATQPALTRRPALPSGLEGVREIAADASGLANDLRRVDVHWPNSATSVTSFNEVAAQLAKERQALAVVHRRQDAKDLFRLLPATDRYHLSALMCPAHRVEVLRSVRAALREQRCCRLVTTQLIEAGVDIDFPVVFRALAGLDSLVQAAGRCNREGALRDTDGRRIPGRFVIFRAESSPPAGILRRGLEVTDAMLARHPDGLEFGDPAISTEYFRLLFGMVGLDAKGIQAQRAELNFATTAQEFRLIDDATWPVVVSWGDAEQRLQRHLAAPSGSTFRSLQPFTVRIYDQQLHGLLDKGAVTGVSEGLYSLAPPFLHLYDAECGLLGGEDAIPDPEAMIA